jgi:hypothetical protein
MPDAFTIRILVPDGDPEGIRIIDLMNWTGKGVVFPRQKWPDVKLRGDLASTGIYILVGAGDDVGNDVVDDARKISLPIIYIGQSEDVVQRIDQHNQNKDFWDWAIVFVSTSSSGRLNRAHATWIEHALIQQAKQAKQCKLDNDQGSKEPVLSEADKADTRHFLKELLQILPLVGLRVFEIGKVVATPKATTPSSGFSSSVLKKPTDEVDTIIVPARKAGFDETFLGEDCWYAIRISGGMLGKIKFIAGYQVAPIQAITHYAPVDHIEPYGDGGKYKLVFSEKAKPIGPIPLADAPGVAMMGPKYTSFAKLQTATKLADLLQTATKPADLS